MRRLTVSKGVLALVPWSDSVPASQSVSPVTIQWDHRPYRRTHSPDSACAQVHPADNLTALRRAWPATVFVFAAPLHLRSCAASDNRERPPLQVTIVASPSLRVR